MKRSNIQCYGSVCCSDTTITKKKGDTMAPQCPIFIICLMLIPSNMGLRIINYNSKNNFNIQGRVIERIASVDCPREESTNLNNLGVKEFDECFINSVFIKNVNLATNQLKKIPIKLFDCVQNLECVNVAFNRIPDEELFKFSHQNLKTLILGYQDNQNNTMPFGSLSSQMQTGYFPNLEDLHLDGLGLLIYNLKYRNMFPQLKTLYITDNNITIVNTDFLWNLPSTLTNLHLERNRLKTVNLLAVKSLESLYLDNNPYLKTLRFGDITTLSLRRCFLSSSLVNDFINDVHQSLKVLDLSENYLKEVPENLFVNAKRLDILSLSNNLITTVPDIKGLSFLTKLSLSHNSVNRVENLISSSLEVLNLNHNEISLIIEATFSGLPSLKVLDLSENQLESLPFEWAYGLHKLESLNLDSNKFATFADISVASVTDLRHLYVGRNCFDEIRETELQQVPEDCTIYVL
nr:PH domain leucine-rich repeat-containing protein phosphatase 2-like [Megalopta genalis]